MSIPQTIRSSNPPSPEFTPLESLTIQGRVLQAKVPVGTNGGGSLRGFVSSFSNASRRKLQLHCASFDWSRIIEDVIPVRFVTLSVPEELWNEGRKVFAALDSFRRWLEARSGFRWCVVRREVGRRRGALHYHLLTFGVPFSESRNADNELSRVWTSFLDAGTLPGVVKNGGYVVTDIEVATEESITKYLTKYCTKAAYQGREEAPEPAGVRSELARTDAGCAEAGSWSSSHNGHRWWYIWGTPVYGQLYFHDFGDYDARAVIAHVRRIWRRIVRERRVRRHLWAMFSQLYDDSNLGPEAGQDYGHGVFTPSMVFEVRRQWIQEKVDNPPAKYLEIARRSAKHEERERKRHNWGGLWRGAGFSIMFDSELTGDLLIWAAEHAAEGSQRMSPASKARRRCASLAAA